jgi:predicted nucleic acid-binding protein
LTGGRVGVYLDSSALVKLVISEPESDALRRFLADSSELYSSRIAAVEVHRAVARQTERDAGKQVDAVLETLRFMELDEAMALAAAVASPRTLRTLDAMHLASATAMASGLQGFVTYDARLAAAARDAGLEVATPST